MHGPDYPAGVRTDIWHPALAEAHLKEKGLFSFKNDFSPSILGAFGFSPLDFVGNCQKTCKFLIIKNMIFHEFTRIVT